MTAPRTDADALLDRVRKRLGAHGRLAVRVRAPGDRWGTTISVEWVRDYGDQESDWRSASGDSLAGALQAVLDHEDRADASDARGTR